MKLESVSKSEGVKGVSRYMKPSNWQYQRTNYQVNLLSENKAPAPRLKFRDRTLVHGRGACVARVRCGLIDKVLGFTNLPD